MPDLESPRAPVRDPAPGNRMPPPGAVRGGLPDSALQCSSVLLGGISRVLRDSPSQRLASRFEPRGVVRECICREFGAYEAGRGETGGAPGR